MPELIITGIPRSGTSYLCHVLYRMSNCVILNEPPEAIRLLRTPLSPHVLTGFLRRRRREILDGIAIPNKLHNGQLTQDTARSEEMGFYRPPVQSADFALGVKQTLAFLSRLRWIRKSMPEARIVACVRNPFDTIASWKNSFFHLNIADVVRQPVGSPIDPLLTPMQQKDLKTIAAIAHPAFRRAAWWNYLANLILEFRHDLILIRYEQFVAHPRETVNRILADWPAGIARQPIEPSTARRHPQSLGEDDRIAIRALCREPALELGLEFENF